MFEVFFFLCIREYEKRISSHINGLCKVSLSIDRMGKPNPVPPMHKKNY